MPPAHEFRCRAVLLDMDGTLVDSTHTVARIWGQWAKRHGFDVDAVVAAAHGRRTIDTVRAIAPHLPSEQEAKLVEDEEVRDREGVVQVAGAAELLSALPPKQWAVVTSATRRLATARMEHVGLPAPPVLVTADDILHGKPDPEGYLKAAAILGIAAAECMVVEDTQAGIAAARAAGMAVLGIGSTFGCAQLTADACVADFREVSVTRDGDWIHLRVPRA